MDITDRRRLVPNKIGALMQVLRQGIPRIVVAVTTWKDDNSYFI